MDTIIVSIYYLLDIVSWIIVIRSLMTWFPGGIDSKLYDILSTLTEPIEGPIRMVLGKYMNGPVDFTPLVAILVIMVLRQVLMVMLMG